MLGKTILKRELLFLYSLNWGNFNFKQVWLTELLSKWQVKTSKNVNGQTRHIYPWASNRDNGQANHQWVKGLSLIMKLCDVQYEMHAAIRRAGQSLTNSSDAMTMYFASLRGLAASRLSKYWSVKNPTSALSNTDSSLWHHIRKKSTSLSGNSQSREKVCISLAV